MALYNTPLEPGLRLSVAQQQNLQVTAPAAFNVGYLLMEQGSSGTLNTNALNLITSLDDYRTKIGGVPTTYKQLVDYLSVSAFLDNSNGVGLLQVIPVAPPIDISTVTVGFTTTGETTAVYSATVNATVINAAVPVPSGGVAQNEVAKDLAARISADPILSSVIYIRQVLNNAIELAPLVSGTILSFNFATPAIGNVGSYLVPAASFTVVQNPPASTVPSVIDYGQTLETVLTDGQPLGFILAPGFFATSTAVEGFALATIFDNFCRKAKKQHLAYIDVVNPDTSKIPLYSALSNYVGGQVLAAGSLVLFKGDVLIGAGAGLSAIAAIVAATPVALAARVKLPVEVSFKGATSNVIQSLNATAQIAIPASPTALELQNFVPIPAALLISEGIAAGKVLVKEKSSATESGLYDWRNNFNSLEGHVIAVGPYQKYNGLEVTNPYVIPASAYLAALHVRVAEEAGLATPPASDSYALTSTAGPIWEVTSPGHALLNGRGVNIIKTINSAVYVMGSRTLSKADLYNRSNNRAILSAYVRTMTLALSSGIVLRPLDSTGTQLAGIKGLMDQVSEAFYAVGYFSGITSGDAYRNDCSNLNNPPSSLQQGIVNATSTVQQLGMIESLRVVISEALLGT
jgi:hypothetical protein